MTRQTRLTLSDPVGMAEPLRPEIAEELKRRNILENMRREADREIGEIFEQREGCSLRRQLACIIEDEIPRILAEALVNRFGTAKARRLLVLAADFAEGA